MFSCILIIIVYNVVLKSYTTNVQTVFFVLLHCYLFCVTLFSLSCASLGFIDVVLIYCAKLVRNICSVYFNLLSWHSVVFCIFKFQFFIALFSGVLVHFLLFCFLYNYTSMINNCFIHMVIIFPHTDILLTLFMYV